MTQSGVSSVEANRNLARQFFQEQDRLRGGPAEALCAPAYRVTINSNPPMDRAAHEMFSKAFYAGLPDTQHHIEDVIATEDRVVVRFVIHAMHTGNLFGIPPTGRSVVVPAHVIMDVSNGPIAKLMGVFDEAGMLRQIGVLKG